MTTAFIVFFGRGGPSEIERRLDSIKIAIGALVLARAGDAGFAPLLAVTADAEAHRAFAWEYGANYAAMPPLLRGRLDESKGTTPAEYDEARRIADRARAALAGIFEDIDVLLTLSAPGAAPNGLASTGDPRYNRLWTLMGVPCVNIPAYVADGGLPVGVQVIARFGDDAGALAAARFVEDALARG